MIAFGNWRRRFKNKMWRAFWNWNIAPSIEKNWEYLK